MGLKRKKRVRLHMLDPRAPSVEGILAGKRLREYAVAVPSLIVSPEAAPARLESRLLLIPREQVVFYEEL